MLLLLAQCFGSLEKTTSMMLRCLVGALGNFIGGKMLQLLVLVIDLKHDMAMLLVDAVVATHGVSRTKEKQSLE
jgi:hypothetical protein